jgi:hypothetical protein
MSEDNDQADVIEVICTQWVKIHNLRVLAVAAVQLTIEGINSSWIFLFVDFHWTCLSLLFLAININR